MYLAVVRIERDGTDWGTVPFCTVVRSERYRYPVWVQVVNRSWLPHDRPPKLEDPREFVLLIHQIVSFTEVWKVCLSETERIWRIFGLLFCGKRGDRSVLGTLIKRTDGRQLWYRWNVWPVSKLTHWGAVYSVPLDLCLTVTHYWVEDRRSRSRLSTERYT